MKTSLLILLLTVISTLGSRSAYARERPVEKDTIEIASIIKPPIYDGIDDDECWQNQPCHLINQVWMPWGDKIDSTDFSGCFKVVWSQTENLLYFLVRIHDDIVSDAYVPGKTASIFNFDMFEVFIDENRTGGYHVFDGNANNERSLGVNAESAFAYHIFTEFPDSGTCSRFLAEDLGGTDWDHFASKLYNNHFPDFILRRDGTVNTWEFSLKVFNDSYSDENPDASRIVMSPGKVMGLTVAYNDDDQPDVNPLLTVRDNFIGSAAVNQRANNDHWKNSDDFGIAKLVLSE